MSSYVVTGGSKAFVDQLAAFLRRPVLGEPSGTIDAWIHLVPGGGDESQSLSAAVATADGALPRGEVAAGAARSLARARIERWSDEGRRFNIVA